MTKGRRQWIWLAIGAVIIALIFYNLSGSPEWRNFRWDRFWASIVDARLGLPTVKVSSAAAPALLLECPRFGRWVRGRLATVRCACQGELEWNKIWNC